MCNDDDDDTEGNSKREVKGGRENLNDYFPSVQYPPEK